MGNEQKGVEVNFHTHHKKKVSISLIVFLVIFIPILLILLTIITKSIIAPNKIPDVFGIKPFIVLNDAETGIKKGDLIFTKIVDESKIQVGDIICYKDKNIVMTHKVTKIKTIGSGTDFIMNDTLDGTGGIKINANSLEGKYLFRIPHLGGILQSSQAYLAVIIIILGIGLVEYTVYYKKHKE